MSNISRRDFMKKSAMGAVGIAAAGALGKLGLSSALAEEPAQEGYSYEELISGSGSLKIMPGDIAALGHGPEIDPAKIVEVIDTDICVCGAGITGISAARAAAEAGSKVVVLEKNNTVEIHGFQCGVLNSTIQKELGAEEDPEEVLHEFQRRSAGRANMQLAQLWAYNSGAVWDWWYDAVDDKPQDMIDNVTLAYYPRCPEHDVNSGLCKTFLGSIDLKEDSETGLGSRYWIAIGKANMAKAEAAGAQFIFSTPAVSLIQDEEGAVKGVYGRDADGNYHQINTSKGVILTTGGLCVFNAGSEPMHKVFAPQLYKNSVIVNGAEPAWRKMFMPNSGIINGATGDGQLMAVWAGAQMDPWADCAMSSAETAIGGTVALSINKYGKRYWNEDMGIWEKHDQLMNQPDRICFDIIDVNWRDMLPYQELGHRNFQYIDGPVAIGWGGKEYINKFHEEILESVGKPEGVVPSLNSHAGAVYGANTLEELADLIHIPRETFLETVARYNEMCDAHKDVDFGCDPQKLMPIKTAPFFACSTKVSPSMAAYGGVLTDEKLRVLSRDGTVIKGLYAAGSCAGGKFSPGYSTLTSGMNHGLGITHGHFAGVYASEE